MFEINMGMFVVGELKVKDLRDLLEVTKGDIYCDLTLVFGSNLIMF